MYIYEMYEIKFLRYMIYLNILDYWIASRNISTNIINSRL